MGKPYLSELNRLRNTYEGALKIQIDSLNSFVEASQDLPLIAVGSGGSLTTARFAELLHEQTGLPSKSMTPLELLSSKLPLSKISILMVTASGRNADIITSFEYAAKSEPRELMGLCCKKGSPLSTLSKEYNYVHFFDFNLPHGKDGFLATNSLIAFTTILCRAYHTAGLYDLCFPRDLIPNEGVLKSFNGSRISEAETFIVLYGKWGMPAAVDLESKFTEAALGQVQLADFRNFGHGRHHWVAKHPKDTAIVVFSTPEDTDITNRTLSCIPSEIPVVRITTMYGGPIGCLDLLIKNLFFVKIVGDLRRIDPGRPRIPLFGRKLYHLKYLKKHRKTKKDILHDQAITAIKKKMPSLYLKNRGDLLKLWELAYEKFIRNLDSTRFGSLIFDYDGTLCDSQGRFFGSSKEIRDVIVSLLQKNLILGIVTGRGKSVKEDLAKFIPKEYHSKVIIGYYNGAEVALLNDNNAPNRDADPNPLLVKLAETLKADRNFSQLASYELRPKQLTIQPRSRLEWQNVRRLIFNRIYTDDLAHLKIVESSHSIDILSEGVTKLNILKKAEEMNRQLGRPNNPLCIGDKGEWPGNDYELLSTPFSLSVDSASPNPDSCWNIAPAGHRGVQATLDYIAAIEMKDQYFKFDVRSIGIRK